jgi:hypothetical protein
MTIIEPVTDQDTLLRAKINRQFDRVRARLGCENDDELARFFGVYRQRISEIRNLKINRIDRALILILLDDAPPLPDELVIETP